MFLKKRGSCTAKAVSLFLLLTASTFLLSDGVSSASVGPGTPVGSGARNGSNLPDRVEIDPNRLPPVPQPEESADVPIGFPPQPQECAYSSADGKPASIHLNVSPREGAAFRCPGDRDELTPTKDRHVFLVRRDGTCDTSEEVSFGDLGAPLFMQSVDGAPGLAPSHKRFATFSWSFGEERRLCYVCKEGTRAAPRTCTVFLSLAKAPHVTSKSADTLLYDSDIPPLD